MGKLDLSALRYLTSDDFRVLTAIEMGMRNHEIVPVELIESIAKLKKSNTSKVISNLLKHKLIEHSNVKYDGYSLNFIGYDYLAIHTLMKRGVLVKIGPKLGVGKESDVFICYVNAQSVDKKEEKEITDEEYNKLKEKIIEENESDYNFEEESENSEKSDKDVDETDKSAIEDKLINKFEEELKILDIQCHIAIIKLARLGRTSFRAVKSKRDYVKNKSHYNWLYLSRISAVNEFKFLSALYENKFSVPKPYGHNRHAIIMQYIPSYPLCRIDDLGDKETAYNELVSIIYTLATKGLIHGDFNEFNLLVQINTQKMYFIDFPQMISISHEEAEDYFLRDINCINKFFKKKFGMTFENNTVDFKEVFNNRQDYLDIKLKAYGYDNALREIEEREKLHKEELKAKAAELLNDAESEEEKEDDDLDFEYGDELKVDGQHDNKSFKIEIDPITIKEKVKKLLSKENKKHMSKTNNRFKGKKKVKI